MCVFFQLVQLVAHNALKAPSMLDSVPLAMWASSFRQTKPHALVSYDIFIFIKLDFKSHSNFSKKEFFIRAQFKYDEQFKQKHHS